jgi:menaquinone-9 beta-reductase
MNNYDVIIVGAGPAGLRCAEILSKTELSVLLLEKNPFVGNKVCAGGITRKGFQMMQIPEEIIQHKVVEVALHSKHYKNHSNWPEPVMYTVNRREFGEWQLNRLKGTQIEVRLSTKVTEIKENHILTNKKEEIAFKFLVGADGPNSMVRRYLKIPLEKVLASVQYVIPQKNVAPSMGVYLNTRYFHSWYAWLFPHKDSIIVGTCADAKYVSGKKMKDKLHAWMKKEGYDISNAEYQSYPISYDYRGIQFGNFFLAGEAAGMASGLTGEGIYQSLVCGEEVAKLIINPNYVSKPMEHILRYNDIQYKFLKFSQKIGFLRGPLHDLIILIMRNKRFNKKITKGFS